MQSTHDGKTVSGLSNPDRISSEFQKPPTLDLIQWIRSLFLLGNFHSQKRSFCHLSQKSCNYARFVFFHCDPVTISKTNHNILVENMNDWKKVFAWAPCSIPISAKTTTYRCSPAFETLSTDWLQKWYKIIHIQHAQLYLLKQKVDAYLKTQEVPILELVMKAS